jgi:hypothetical protein
LAKVVTEQQVRGEQVLAAVAALAAKPPLQQPQEGGQLAGLMAAAAAADILIAEVEVLALVAQFVLSGPETPALSHQLVLVSHNLLELK